MAVSTMHVIVRQEDVYGYTTAGLIRVTYAYILLSLTTTKFSENT